MQQCLNCCTFSCHSGVYLRLVALTPLYSLQMPAANDIH